MDSTHFFFWIISEFILGLVGMITIYVRLINRINVLEIRSDAKDKELERVWSTIKDVANEATRREEKIMVKLEEIAKSITGIQIDAAKNSSK
jgi:predicted Holliday junction resolvase-like endonuclease